MVGSSREGGNFGRRLFFRGAVAGTAGLVLALMAGCDVDGGRDRREELEKNMALVNGQKQRQVDFLAVVADAETRASKRSYLEKQLELFDKDTMKPGSVISWASRGCRGPYDLGKVPLGTSQRNHRGELIGPEQGRGIALEFCVVDNVREGSKEATPMLWMKLAYGVRCTPGINPELMVAWHVVTAELEIRDGLK